MSSWKVLQIFACLLILFANTNFTNKRHMISNCSRADGCRIGFQDDIWKENSLKHTFFSVIEVPSTRKWQYWNVFVSNRLVFSQSLLSLDLIESFLEHWDEETDPDKRVSTLSCFFMMEILKLVIWIPLNHRDEIFQSFLYFQGFLCPPCPWGKGGHLHLLLFPVTQMCLGVCLCQTLFTQYFL